MAHRPPTIPPARTELLLVGQPPAERADAAHNRRRILAAAADIVAARGPDGLSVSDVARAADVGVGTIYRRFGDRTGLLYALLDEREREFQAAFVSGPPPLGPGGPAGPRVRAFLHALLDRVEAQLELLLLAETSSPGARYTSTPYRLSHLHLAALLERAAPGADSSYLAHALLAPLSPTLIHHQRRELGITSAAIKAGLDDLLAGVGGSGPG